MEKRKPGRPPKSKAKEEVKKEEVVQENNEDVKPLFKEKPKSKTGYKVKASFFYKGIQFHPGQDIGYNEQLLKLGKIEKV